MNQWDWLGLAETCDGPDDVGNLKNLQFEINIETLAGGSYSVSDPGAILKELAEKRARGESPDEALLKKLKELSEAAAKGFATFGRALNIIQNIREIQASITITSYEMYGSMECCKCKSDEGGLEFYWEKVNGYDNWQGNLAMTEKGDRKLMFLEVKDVTVSVAEQIAKACPKTKKSPAP